MKQFIDHRSQTLRGITYAHWRIHHGQLFNWHVYNSMAAAAVLEYYIKTPDSLTTHSVINVEATGQVQVKLIEGITTSANGTTLTSYNMNRSASATPYTIIHAAPTWSTNSEVTLVNTIVPGGNTPLTRVGGGARQDTEWVLAQGTKYLLQITNQAAATISVAIQMEYNEPYGGTI